MTAEVTRRNLFKIGGLAAAGLGGAALLGACSPAGNATGSTACYRQCIFHHLHQ